MKKQHRYIYILKPRENKLRWKKLVSPPKSSLGVLQFFFSFSSLLIPALPISISACLLKVKSTEAGIKELCFFITVFANKHSRDDPSLPAEQSQCLPCLLLFSS
uniref:Uncharacterized protein n=1 Tax=Micrurus lemniscatus lemniscatus TaxID=129467 RepID=A0A2D4JGQ0_MICLE